MKTNRLLHLSALASALVLSPSVQAQTVDYGSLQSLFGEPVTTSATGTPQRASDVAANMTIITADDIRRSGSRNIPEIIGQYVPGIDIFQSGVNAFDVGVRGYQQAFQPRLLVLVDGRQVFVDDYSRTIWGNIPVNIDDIRQIEVVKGAASALFGSNAAGGVVNIITSNPVYDHKNIATVRYGTQDTYAGDATVGTKIGQESGMKISVGGMRSNEFSTDHNPLLDPVIYDPLHQYVSQSSVFQVTPKFLVNTEVTYALSHENPQQPTLSGRSAEATETDSFRGGFVWQTDYGLITNNNYYYHSGSNATVSGTRYPGETNLFVSQLQDQFKLGANHTARVALEYRNKGYDYDYIQAFPQDPSFEQNVFAASGAWVWQIRDGLSWTNALRVDHQTSQQSGTLNPISYYSDAEYSRDIDAWSANSGLVYKVTPRDTLRATYGRGVQFPSFIEGSDNTLVPVAPNTYYDLEGNPYLKPTIVENYEMAYDRQIPELHSTFKIAPFYEINRDLIAFAVDSSTVRMSGGNAFILLQSANVGDSRGFGGELEFAGAQDGYRWGASYSYARLRDSTRAATTLGYDGSTPAHHFRLSGGYTTGPWEFDAYGLAVTKLRMQYTVGNKVETDGYYSLSSRVGYKVDDHFTVALSGANITQARTEESPFPAVERQLFLTLTGSF